MSVKHSSACPVCRELNDRTKQYCDSCGAKLPWVAQVAAAGSRPVPTPRNIPSANITFEDLLQSARTTRNHEKSASTKIAHGALSILFCLFLLWKIGSLLLNPSPEETGDSPAVVITSEQEKTKEDAFYTACDVIESQLKTPSTAKFCLYSDAFVESLPDSKYRISGYVDSENSFGARLRSDWTVVLRLEGNAWHTESLNTNERG